MNETLVHSTRTSNGQAPSLRRRFRRRLPKNENRNRLGRI